MALSDHGQYSGVVDIARNGIDEVIRLQTQAKQDTELIQQMVDALEGSIAITMVKIDQRNAALIAGRAWREEKPCA